MFAQSTLLTVGRALNHQGTYQNVRQSIKAIRTYTKQARAISKDTSVYQTIPHAQTKCVNIARAHKKSVNIVLSTLWIFELRLRRQRARTFVSTGSLFFLFLELLPSRFCTLTERLCLSCSSASLLARGLTARFFSLAGFIRSLLIPRNIRQLIQLPEFRWGTALDLPEYSVKGSQARKSYLHRCFCY